jgi:hypothetical protein
MKSLCGECRRERTLKGDTARIPAGWKRKGEALLCGDCWRTHYVLRAVSIPVASPLDMAWDEFGRALRAQWALITQASNWMLTELYTRDDRSRETGKLKPMPKVYLYPETRRLFPGLPSQTAAALEQAIAKKYRARRYEIVWLAKASLPTYRYPAPFPAPNQGWTVSLEDGHAIVSVRIGDARVRLRLRGGHQFRRQMAAVKQIVAGEAERGQLDLYRHGDAVMCKMVAWLPRGAAGARADGTLFVRTDADALLVALNQKDEKLWTYHGDQARRWSAEHRKLLQRLADDSKAEHRPVPPFSTRRENAATKYRDRMSSLTHQAAAMVVGYAQRRRFAVVSYDDALATFCEQFPWFALRAKIAEKCNAAGIEFQYVAASGEAKPEVAQPLAKE